MATTKLLLVEDEPNLRESLREFLRGQGFDTAVAADEEGAWREARRFKPGVVLSDLVLVKGSGLSLIRRIRQDPAFSGVRCVLMTGHGSLESAVQALKLGVDDFLLKPFQLEELSHALANAPATEESGFKDRRSQVVARLDQALALARRMGHRSVAIKMSLRGLASLPAGERALLLRRLQETLRASDTLLQLEAEEVAVILYRVKRAADVSLVFSKMETVVEGFGEGFALWPAAGVAIYPEDGEDPVDLLRKADTALSRASEGSRLNFASEELNRSISFRRQMTLEIGKALARKEFYLELQPQVALPGGEITGAEALLRWRRSDGKAVGPGEFIPVAEETGLIHPLGLFVLEESCRIRRALEKAGHGHVHISLNLSPRQFLHRNLVPSIESALSRSGADPRGMTVEITESSTLSDENEAVQILERIRVLGLSVALDDFGTGFSSLSHLRLFPIRTLKLDRSFIRDIATRDRDATMVHSLVGLAHALGMDVVAEGVESDAQRDILLQMGCDRLQGYLTGRPQPVEQFFRLLQDEKRPT